MDVASCPWRDEGFQFVPGQSGGDVAGSGCGEQDRVRGEANAAEVKAVCVQTDCEGRIGLGTAPLWISQAVTRRFMRVSANWK